LLLGLILLLATGLRLYQLNAKSFWYDEFASAELACGHGYAHYLLPENVIIEHPPKLFDLHSAAPIGKLWRITTAWMSTLHITASHASSNDATWTIS